MTILHERRWKHELPDWRRQVEVMLETGLGAEPPPGPWDTEPDKVQWVDGETDLDCLAVRNHYGAWCGYVGVPQGHPAYGRDYSEVEVDVHGSLTFASACDESAAEGHGICHVPLPGRPGDVWWLGFDCGHYMDYQPGMEMVDMPPMKRGTYRTLAYVQAECASLAGQLV